MPRYSLCVTQGQTLPNLWLVSDQRNDAMLEAALHRLPRGSGFVFRHYHLGDAARAARFRDLRALASQLGIVVIVSDTQARAAAWQADGIYGPPERLGPHGDLLRLATAHNGDELQAAIVAGADGVFLSPVFPTASHPGAPTLGAMGFHMLAQQSPIPVIALGGMNAQRAEELGWPRWAAIDGLA